MKLLIIDTETNGLDPKTHQVLEIGAILYDTNYGILQQASTLIPADENEAFSINKIDLRACKEVMAIAADLVRPIFNMGAVSNYAVAHNAAFDKQWFNGDTLPMMIGKGNDLLPWLCTCNDFKFKVQTKPRQSLVELALLHAVPVISAHRALIDCQLIAGIFDKLRERGQLDEAIAYALLPSFTAVAQVSYRERDLAKQAGFSWVESTKSWEKRIKEHERDSFNFPIELKIDL